MTQTSTKLGGPPFFDEVPGAGGGEAGGVVVDVVRRAEFENPQGLDFRLAPRFFHHLDKIGA
jgi:hypothetical protein